MEIVFPDPKSKDMLSHYMESKNGGIKIAGVKYDYSSDKFSSSIVKEFFLRNNLFTGFEDRISGNIEAKIRNKKTKIMGILNATPDSFFNGSRVSGTETIDRMIDLKPDIIDIGGESTRPGSSEVDPETEFSRIKSILEYIKSVSDIPVSVDSRHYETIKRSMKYGISYINDISGFEDQRMIDIARDNGVKCIVMHMRGTPQNMDQFTSYDNIFVEINTFFYNRINAMIQAGIDPENIILDPGIGFSKDFQGNVSILRSPWSFFLGFDTLFGTSRKSIIGKITGSSVEDRAGGTIATSIYLNNNGVDVIRVHDVLPNRDAITMYRYIEDS
jgi:dihydropteroate synthase